MLSPNLEQTLRRALAYANDRRHDYATLEHLLLALVDDQDAIAVMRACNVDVERLRRDLSDYVDNQLGNIVGSHHAEAKPTAGFQRVLQRAAIHVQSSGREEVTGANILVALFSERESHAVFFLQEQEMSRLALLRFTLNGGAGTVVYQFVVSPSTADGLAHDAAFEPNNTPETAAPIRKPRAMAG